MKVKDLMSTKLFTVGPEDMLDRVFFLFNFGFRPIADLLSNVFTTLVTKAYADSVYLE